MSEQTGSTGPRPEQTFFDAPAIDRLMGVVMPLATEVYVLRDRDAFVEHLLSNLLGQQQSKGALR